MLETGKKNILNGMKVLNTHTMIEVNSIRNFTLHMQQDINKFKL